MSDVLVDNQENEELTRQGEEMRAQGVWLLGHVTFAAWIFFGVFYWCIGREAASSWCGLQCLAYLTILFSMRNSKAYCAIMWLFLGSCLIGITTIAAIEPIVATSIYFAPFAILVASQLFGTRQARYCLVCSMFAMTTHFAVTHGLESLVNDCLIQLTLGLGLCVAVFLVCQQFELHYQKKTQNLVSFSNSLQAKSIELRKLATTDSLTGLANRYQLKQNLEDCIQQANTGEPFALLLVDMDGFKEINDTLGHAVGDQVLVEIGNRLTKAFGEFESVGRLGGDEFCLIAKGVDSMIEARNIAKQVYRELTKKYFLEDNDFNLGASVGFALAPRHATSSNDILAFADTAMYEAKQNQLPVAGYTKEMTIKLIENRDLNEQLSEAIGKNEFFLTFQPQVSLSNEAILGVETLLRWKKDGRLISPGRFVPLLEQTNQIVEVGAWVIEEVCRQKAQWRSAGIDLTVAINISARQFELDGFIDSIVEPIQRWGLDFEGFDLEITESLLISNVDDAVRKLVCLKEYGVSISIDDFGTGYSSLAYLRQFPIDKLKIDRAFVKDIPHGDDGTLASSITLLGHVLGMKVVAEGIETEEQLRLLKEQGCDEYQGFYFSKPLPSKEITELLLQHKTESVC